MKEEYARKWIDGGGWGVTGVVDWNKEAECFTWLCSWGCFGYSYEGELDAHEMLNNHECNRGA